MKIDVHLHTLLQRPSPEGLQRRLEVDLPDGGTLGELIHQLEITLPVDAMLLVVNGRHAPLETRLQPGDEVHLMPAISGGCV
ncbi:MAG TPA: MoaD/ThiS family protein [Anaerolineales bacterium]|nr:MoaD/ThiS family protein [Anaerolineales bacterium]